MNRTKLALTLSLMLFLAACSQGEKTSNQAGANTGKQASSTNDQAVSTKTPPADVVKASADPVEVKAGASAEANVKLTVASGYHINANPASFDYLIPTALQLQPGPDITADAPVYPASVTKQFKFSPQPLKVYEGDVSIKVNLKAGSKAQKGEQKVAAHVRVQPCDEESCYPPRTIETTIPVTVK
ncbi:MAG TPA: protein-disulfide reductase DsbD domain-containing protein [Pyrinomonadaceae bacterium]